MMEGSILVHHVFAPVGLGLSTTLRCPPGSLIADLCLRGTLSALIAPHSKSVIAQLQLQLGLSDWPKTLYSSSI